MPSYAASAWRSACVARLPMWSTLGDTKGDHIAQDDEALQALREELLDAFQSNRAIAADALRDALRGGDDAISSLMEVVAMHRAMFDALAELLDRRPIR